MRDMSVIGSALIVIDAQESFRHRPFFSDDGLAAYVERQQALIDGAKAKDIPVVQIFHIADSGVFSEASGHVTTLAPLQIEPDAVFRKRRHSALVGTGLDVWLTSNGIRRLIVSGIRTEQCCETTTRHASDLGYTVSFVGEATLTFPMTDAAGRIWSAAEIRGRTELVLSGRFARIATVAEAFRSHGKDCRMRSARGRPMEIPVFPVVPPRLPWTGARRLAVVARLPHYEPESRRPCRTSRFQPSFSGS